MKIRIEEFDDSLECPTCGTVVAHGASIKFPTGDEIDLTPFANCIPEEAVDYSSEEILLEVLNYLGYEVIYE